MRENGPASPVPSAPKRASIPQLDTIRVVAMLAVFLHHLWKTVIPEPQTIAQSILDPVFTYASIAVILFNMVSGFVLAMPHLGPSRRPVPGYRQWLRKRFLRIIPSYYTALLVFTAGNMLFFSYPLRDALNMLFKHLLFINSLDYSYMLSNFSHFWYLGQLAQFYLVFPLILRLFKRMGPTAAALSIIACSWAGWIFLAVYFPSASSSQPNFWENLMRFNLPGHLPEFAIGMWLASIWYPSESDFRRIFSHKAFSVLACVMILYFIFGTPLLAYMNLPFFHIYHVALSVIVFLILFTWNVSARVGHSALFRNFAERSYSMYIVHHPIFSYAGVMPSQVTHSLPNFALLTLLLLPLTYIGATILDRMSGGVIERVSERSGSAG
jgi:peptidoglycan/LPS O-acetylase OafA/YrhL